MEPDFKFNIIIEKKSQHIIHDHAGIHCSVDGPADIHDKNRPLLNGQGSFAKVKKNIGYALKITPNDTSRITVSPDNAGDVCRIVETIFDLGFKSAGVFPASNMDLSLNQINDWANSVRKAYKYT